MKSIGKPQVIEESLIGLYVWEMPTGQWVGDDEGNFLNIPAQKGDQKRIQILRDTAREFGITEGKPVFLSGNRRVTDEEFEEQKQRLKWGLIPDELDLPAFIEDEKHGRV